MIPDIAMRAGLAALMAGEEGVLGAYVGAALGRSDVTLPCGRRLIFSKPTEPA